MTFIMILQLLIVLAALYVGSRYGTTRIGKYLLNHSFMMPGLVSVITSTIVASLITKLIY